MTWLTMTWRALVAVSVLMGPGVCCCTFSAEAQVAESSCHARDDSTAPGCPFSSDDSLPSEVCEDCPRFTLTRDSSSVMWVVVDSPTFPDLTFGLPFGRCSIRWSLVCESLLRVNDPGLLFCADSLRTLSCLMTV